MTNKEWDFFLQTLQEATRRAYTKGHEDGSTKKPLKIEVFTLTRAHKLRLETELKKSVEGR